MESLIKFGKETFVGKTEGTLADYYDVLKQLGKGGYGKVYQVKNKKTKEIRACKHLSKLNIPELEKFKREIDILMKVDHPNIIKLYEVFESAKSLYLVMEECNGGELFDKILEHIESGTMYTEKDAANMLLQVMSAIEYCHQNGICHRDLKPENLLYLNEGEEKNNPIKVIDFGLSQLISENKITSKVGTAYYVSPEILKGTYTEKCDIWSAGVILYILLCGDPPFNGANDNVIYSKIARMKYEFDDKWKNISAEAKDLISHMLLPEAERYTARQVLAHPWFAKMKEESQLSSLQIDTKAFKAYKDINIFKKMILLFISTRLNENDINILKKGFEEFDTNKDGQISLQELENGLKQLKNNTISPNEVQDLFKAIDTDKNGKIDYTEFIAATIQEKIYLKDERLYEAFASFDKDGSGTISKDEIMSVLKLEAADEKEVDRLIKLADKNNDGVIDYKEFVELMKK